MKRSSSGSSGAMLSMKSSRPPDVRTRAISRAARGASVRRRARVKAHEPRFAAAGREAWKFSAARPDRSDLPVLIAGGRGVRICGRPGDEPAWCRPVGAARPSLCGAAYDDGRVAGGAGVRWWGRAWARGAPAQWWPHPASRTPGPCPWPRAPALGASACSVGGRSSKGTCVRKATVLLGRKTAQRPGSRRRNLRIPRPKAKSASSGCNSSCKASESGPGRVGS
jgi:hypothetical protein